MGWAIQIYLKSTLDGKNVIAYLFPIITKWQCSRLPTDQDIRQNFFSCTGEKSSCFIQNLLRPKERLLENGFGARQTLILKYITKRDQ